MTRISKGVVPHVRSGFIRVIRGQNFLFARGVEVSRDQAELHNVQLDVAEPDATIAMYNVPTEISIRKHSRHNREEKVLRAPNKTVFSPVFGSKANH